MQTGITQSSEKEGAPRAAVLALCGLAAALAFDLLPIPNWLVHGSSIGRLLAREGIFWGYTLAILLWLTLAEQLPLKSIGFRRPTWKGVAIGILTGIVITATMVVQFAVIIPLFHLSTAAILARKQAIMSTPYWYRVLLVLRAAVTEEILFRGYLIEKVRQLSGSTALAVVVSVAAFTYAHLGGWGPVHLISVSVTGLLLALVYVWRHDLPSNMLAHFLADAAGFLTG
jgi:uncharacterized protein